MGYNVSKYVWISCAFVSVAFTSCFWLYSEGGESHHLGKGFWLSYFSDPVLQTITVSNDTVNANNGGSILIDKTVYAVGYNRDFIIAKKHPNSIDSIGDRLFKSDETKNGDFLLTNPDDSVYLSKDDKVYEKNGKWYHISNGWNPPDSLNPNRRITFYYIIDTRNYHFGDFKNIRDSLTCRIYKFNNKIDFDKKRQEIGVPANLDFTLVKKAIE